MQVKHLLQGVIAFLLVAMTTTAMAQDNFTVQILHNNDAESNLLINDDGFGGAAQFLSTLNALRFEAFQGGYPSILLSSGDNYLPGKEFDASLDLPAGEPFFDAVAIDLFNYDALALGNHDFDFGPDILARFLEGLPEDEIYPVFLSANLDFTGEPALQEQVANGRIQESTIIYRGSERIGVVGLTTPNLPFITSPGDVVINDDLLGELQTEIDELTARGINKIILISHLQGIEEERALIADITNVDVVIAGGGDNLLANDPSEVIPSDSSEVSPDFPYPLVEQDADGNDVYVVTTAGNLRYIGNLTVTFNADGEIIEVADVSGPVPVKGTRLNPMVEEMVENPVAEHVAGLEEDIIGTTEVNLDGRRNSVRGFETNEGNLIADAFLWQATQSADEFGVAAPQVAIANGGGIRNDNIIAAGSEISVGTTFDILPFGNVLSIVDPIPASQFKLMLENAVSRVELVNGVATPQGGGTGRFPQIAGATITYDITGTPAVLEGSGADITVVEEGSRIVDVVLDDGTVIVEDGVVVEGAPDISVATGDFTAAGGDQYPFLGATINRVGVSDQQALANYIQQELEGTITAADYPEGGEGRITIVEPGNNLGATTTALAASNNTVTAPKAYPNPVSDDFTLEYHLENDSEVNITIMDVRGQVAAQIFDGIQPAGAHRFTLNATANNMPAGVYFIHLKTGDETTTLRLVTK